MYRPLWFVQRKVIMGYVSVPCRVTADNVVLLGGAAMPLSLASPENAALDRLTIRRVVNDLKELISLNRKSVLVAPIHHLTVANAGSRRVLVDHFAETSEELRNLVVFELIGVPEEIGAKDLTWTIEALKPHGKAVLVRRRLESLSIPVLREGGAYGTGAEIGNYSAPEREIIPAMARFVEAADQAGLATYIHGLRTVSLVSTAMGAGFDYIDGDPIAEIDEAPNCIFPFDLRNLYQDVLDAPA